MTADTFAADATICRDSLARHSRSFALAGRLLAPATRDALAVVYAWCRRCDDAIDEATDDPHRVLEALEKELTSIYAGETRFDATSRAFQRIVARYDIPREHPRSLLAGMRMDVVGTDYESLGDLRRYAYRVAGVVGLMACPILGAIDPRARRHAADLGIAMQLTNICRDVAEDWMRGRLYLPAEVLGAEVARDLRLRLRRSGGAAPLPVDRRKEIAAAVRTLLGAAEKHYASGRAGLRYLERRSAAAIGSAGLIYRAIGRVIAGRGYDVLAARAIVSTPRKLGLVMRAVASALALVACVVVGVPVPAAAAPPSLPVAATPADPARVLPPGTYRLDMRMVSRASLPLIGTSESAAVSVSLVEIREIDGRLEQTHRVCATEMDGGVPLFRITMPERFIAALATHTYRVDLIASEDGWHYRADLGVERVGYAPGNAGADTLPASAEDASVIDSDGDGQPGATLGLSLPIAPDGALYVVQRGHSVLRGVVEGPGRVSGHVEVLAFEQRLIGARPSFLARSPAIVPDSTRSRFTLVGIAAGTSCAELRAAGPALADDRSTS